MSKSSKIIMFSMLGFFLCLFIVGTFFDLQINEAIFHNKDTFGLVISVLGTIPGYAMFAFIGGGALSYGVNKEYKTWIRVISFISCAGCYFASIYFAGREFFGPNGFYHYVSDLVGFAMMVPVMGAVVYLGFRLTKKSENKNLWIVYLVLFVALVIALVPGTTLLKVIFNRPRFRSVSTCEMEYYPWYTAVRNRAELMDLYNIEKEEFKSFPSGHASSSIAFPLFVLFLPYINKDYKKYVLPLFIGGLAWALLVMFARMYVGAHYLSDVSMGAILTTVCILIGALILSNSKKVSTLIEN